MTALMAVLCAAAAAFLLPKGTNTATQRLRTQFHAPPLLRTRPRARDHTGAPRHSATARPTAHPDEHPARTRTTWLRGRRATDQRHPPLREARSAVQRRDAFLRRAAAATAGALCLVTFGGLPGGVIGVLVAVAVWLSFARLGNAERRRRQARLIADLPVAVDLLAACLRGGAPWHEAVAAVADAVGGPLGDELRAVSVQIRLGADPSEAWLALTKEPMLAPLARAAVRATSTGAALAPTLSRLARDQRRAVRSAAAARAQAAGIRALAPLGLCFLPAFVLLGVVPAIAGIASTILLPR